MRTIQLTYNSPFNSVSIKVCRASGNKKFITGMAVKGSGKLSLEIEDDPKYKGNYLIHFFDLFNNLLTQIEVESVDLP